MIKEVVWEPDQQGEISFWFFVFYARSCVRHCWSSFGRCNLHSPTLFLFAQQLLGPFSCSTVNPILFRELAEVQKKTTLRHQNNIVIKCHLFFRSFVWFCDCFFTLNILIRLNSPPPVRTAHVHKMSDIYWTTSNYVWHPRVHGRAALYEQLSMIVPLFQFPNSYIIVNYYPC